MSISFIPRPLRRALLCLSAFWFLSMPASAKVKVVATLPDLASLARAVGGDLVTVDQLTQANQDPHHVNASPSMVVRLSQADLFVMNGLDLEVGWVPALLQASRSQKVRPGGPGYVDASIKVPVIEAPSGPIDRSMGDVHPFGNPHYTLDAGRCKWAAWNIANGLIRVDAANAEQYITNLKNLYARIDAALARAREAMKPYRGSSVIIYHARPNYLLDRLGLRVAATIEPLPGIPPSAAQIGRIISSQKSKGIRAVLIEPWNDRRVAEQVAAGLGEGTSVVVPKQAVGSDPAAVDAIALFEQNVALIVSALKGSEGAAH
ncbi:MAG: metal ABC transporter substrate-binding protein [Candidatus Hydrogenedentota bacterium]